MTLRILIVEDQADVAANVWDYFHARGHLVDHVADGATGLRRAMAEAFDVIILDLGLPRLDGLKLCRVLRDAGRGVPVIMVTARDELDDKLKGFAEGADDYLVKPFALRELEARVKVLAGRGGAGSSAILARYGLELDTASHVVRREGRAIELTRTQAVLLDALLRAAPRVVEREALGRALWGDQGGDANTLHAHIHALRALVDRPFSTSLIRTVYGVGYRLEGRE